MPRRGAYSGAIADTDTDTVPGTVTDTGTVPDTVPGTVPVPATVTAPLRFASPGGAPPTSSRAPAR